MRTAIVTGGLGFLGSYLIELLVDDNYEVIVIDNLSSNCIKPKAAEKLGCRVYIKDLHEVFNRELIRDKVDIVYHLASLVGPVRILNYAGSMAYEMLRDSIVIKDYCLSTRSDLVFISSSEIYNHAGKHNEESDRIFTGDYTIRNEYGIGKLASEAAIINTAKINKNFKYHIIRPFNICGPRQNVEGGFVLARFIRAIKNDECITIYGDGNQRRAFTDVRDISKTIYTIANSKYGNEIWNIGNDRSILSINNLAMEVIREAEFNPGTTYIDPKDIHGKFFTEVPEKMPDITKLKKYFGWNPKYSIKDTIKDSLNYQKD